MQGRWRLQWRQQTSTCTALKKSVPRYDLAIQELVGYDWTQFWTTDDLVVKVCAASGELYGLIHARYITTPSAIELMSKKFAYSSFGTCPGVLSGPVVLLSCVRNCNVESMETFSIGFFKQPQRANVAGEQSSKPSGCCWRCMVDGDVLRYVATILRVHTGSAVTMLVGSDDGAGAAVDRHSQDGS